MFIIILIFIKLINLQIFLFSFLSLLIKLVADKMTQLIISNFHIDLVNIVKFFIFLNFFVNFDISF